MVQGDDEMGWDGPAAPERDRDGFEQPAVANDPMPVLRRRESTPIGDSLRLGWQWLQTLASSAVYAALIITFVGQVARVEGYSMEPTLHNADRLIVNKLAYRLSKPQVGDIVMTASPSEPDKMLVKRVIAGPLDIVRSIDGRIYVNDVPVPDDYIAPDYRSSDTWGPRTVPPGHYFVLGDHRNNSLDSRSFGPIPEKYIEGRIQARWWPLGDGKWF